MIVNCDNIAVITRRLFPFAAAGLLQSVSALALKADQPGPDPWAKGDLMEPAALAAVLNKSGAKPSIICVAFPVLYRQRHIIHAEFAGPASKPEGIAMLQSAVANMPKNTNIVVYCGCCPMNRCPNIRPAYQELKRLGFSNVHVLNIPTNFHDDWVAKGYPVEESVGVPLQAPN